MVKLRIPKASRLIASPSPSSTGGSVRHTSTEPDDASPRSPLISSAGYPTNQLTNVAQDNSDPQSANTRRSTALTKKKKSVASILDSPRRMLLKHRLSSKASINGHFPSSSSSSRSQLYNDGQRREHRDEISTTPLAISAFDSSRTSNSPSTPTSDLRASQLLPFSSDLSLPVLDHSASFEGIQLQQREQSLQMNGATANEQTNNVLQWMHDDAPHDILPKILSFAGPRKMDTLSRVNKSWRKIILSETVWRTACEDTRKWSEGDPVPSSWLQLYKDNPCVPIDYDSVETAFDSICQGNSILGTTVLDSPGAPPRHYREQRRSGRVLLRPGKYVVREALIVHTVGAAEVTIESIDEPALPPPPTVEEDKQTSPKRSASGSSLMELLACRSSSAVATDIDTSIASGNTFQNTDVTTQPTRSPPRRATIILRTRSHNEPIIRVRQGKLNLNRVQLIHNCSGTDIWNGNSAVQVQPAFDAHDNPIRAVPPSLQPTAIVKGCDITSFSGRGIVNIDGGKSTISDCYIHDCAATGVYVGGQGSLATIERTDVLENGNGNQRSRRGIARGHSGIYLEQGTAFIRDSNISNNSLTGISAISTDNAALHVEDSDLVANGSIQLELPPIGSISRERSTSRNNRMQREGEGRFRSGLISDSAADIANSIGQLRRLSAEHRQRQSHPVGDNEETLRNFMRTHAAAYDLHHTQVEMI
uniref:F-box domain-containing protein n=1 Tax=Ditylum brightwellii TaxID=49249 RepID=A0A7S2EU66_9STRA|mmetsp:Transcript_6723/g.10155  ORF Transcript_6723/g.10155 Transcript_6723/m.10155 type:complete len:705 (+) Transcript_6723:42-2156(+)